MNNIYVAIIVVYLLYYAGNIIYDGFLKKEKTQGKEDVQEYSIGDITGEIEENVEVVEIDDVENLNTPNSFQKREILKDDLPEEEYSENNLENWRKSFEAEQELEDLETTPSKEKPEETENSSSGSSKKKKFNIQKMLAEAETKVQVVVDDGMKVYSLT